MSWFDDDPTPAAGDPAPAGAATTTATVVHNQPDTDQPPITAYPDEPPSSNGHGKHHTNGHGTPPKTPQVDIAPHDPLAERNLLGAGLLGVDITATPPDAYYPPTGAHARIAQAIHQLTRAGEPHDSVTVAAQLKADGHLDTVGGHQTLATIIAECPSTTAAAAYARIVQDHWRSRQYLHAAAELATTVRTRGPDAGRQVLRALLDTAEAHRPANSRLLPGSWILDAPATPTAIWGADADVLWSDKEPLLLTGPPGVGKTTLTAQLVRARAGFDTHVLGWPVLPGPSKILYLASDRPQQIRRALARCFGPDDRQRLDDTLTIWPGPPPADIAKDTSTLVRLARDAGATTIILDSLKDMAIGLSDDEVGAGVNQAMQLAIADDIDVLALHHQRKGTDGKRPKTLEDLYGSVWIAAGAGSVLLLWGAPGDPIVELHHLKQPSSDVGPLRIEHDHHTGTSKIHRGFDLHAALRHAHQGLTTLDVARVWLEKDKPTENERRKAQRKLDQLVRQGQATRRESTGRNASGQALPDRYYAVDHHAQEQF